MVNENIRYRDINEEIELLSSEDRGKISDTYHTFDELYEHRIILYIALALSIRVSDTHSLKDSVWKSKKHSDESEWDGWFLLGIGIEQGEQITYHLPTKYWDECDFAKELEKAPSFDGPTSQDVLDRIKKI